LQAVSASDASVAMQSTIFLSMSHSVLDKAVKAEATTPAARDGDGHIVASPRAIGHCRMSDYPVGGIAADA
jgi:hypothetical protein